jgi:hypothetical protein
LLAQTAIYVQEYAVNGDDFATATTPVGGRSGGPGGEGQLNRNPVWSPDGGAIAFPLAAARRRISDRPGGYGDPNRGRSGA